MEDTNNVEFTHADAESMEPVSREVVASSLGLPESASWSDIKIKINELEGKDASAQTPKTAPGEFVN